MDWAPLVQPLYRFQDVRGFSRGLQIIMHGMRMLQLLIINRCTRLMTGSACTHQGSLFNAGIMLTHNSMWSMLLRYEYERAAVMFMGQHMKLISQGLSFL